MFAHAQPHLNSSFYHMRRNEMNCVGSSEYLTVLTSFIRASLLNMRISHLVFCWSEFRSQNRPFCNHSVVLVSSFKHWLFFKPFFCITNLSRVCRDIFRMLLAVSCFETNWVFLLRSLHCGHFGQFSKRSHFSNISFIQVPFQNKNFYVFVGTFLTYFWQFYANATASPCKIPKSTIL
mgnify:CR=1 FL=1